MTIDLIKELKNRKLIFGSKETIKQIAKGNVETIYISADCPFIETIKSAAKDLELKQLKLTALEMQELCKKPFPVSVISILKEKQVEEKIAQEKEKIKKRKKIEESKEKTKKKKKEDKRKK